MRTITILLGFALAAFPAAAQEPAGLEEGERFSVSLLGAVLDGAGELANETQFEPSLAYGGQLTYWALPGVGIRVRGARSEPSFTTQDNVLAGTDPDVWLLTAGVLARRPYVLAGRRVAPYFTAGVGTKRYGFEDPYWAPAVDVGLGLELGAGPVRVFAEAGHVFSELHRMGFWEGQSDWFYGGGITLSLDRPDLGDVAARGSDR